MKLSTGQVVVLVGGVGLVGFYLMRRTPGNPFSLGDFFGTVMPNAPDQQQIARWFADRAGGQPSAAGTSGQGVTATMPAYAGALAQIGNAITGLFRRQAGPGNSQGPDQPRASQSSGGGVAQPVATQGFTMFKGTLQDSLYLPTIDSGLFANINSGLYSMPDPIYSQGVSQEFDLFGE